MRVMKAITMQVSKLMWTGKRSLCTVLPADGYPLVEQVEVPSLDDDISWGRLPNGTGEFTFLPEPSPGKNNETGEPGNDPTPEPDRPTSPTIRPNLIQNCVLTPPAVFYYEVWMSDASGRNLGRIYSGNPDEGHVNVGISTWPLPPAPIGGKRLVTVSRFQPEFRVSGAVVQALDYFAAHYGKSIRIPQRRSSSAGTPWPRTSPV